MGAIAKFLFGISPRDTSFEQRKFRGGKGGMRQRIEKIGRIFAQGYHDALLIPKAETLVPKLESIELEFRGFAYEGAAMGLALLDRLTPWNPCRIQNFLRGAGDRHVYMVHVAVGWVVARLPGSVQKAMAPLDPLLRWLVLDGYGFHEGFFNWPDYILGQTPPKRFTGYECRAFDLGLGRSLWFVDGADVELIRRTIAGFPASRQPDLWSGIGLASVYAGEISDSDLNSLRASAGPFVAQLAQGAAFAAKARQRAGNLTSYTDRACLLLCGISANEAAYVTDAALENLPTDVDEPAFEVWRRRIQEAFAEKTELKG